MNQNRPQLEEDRFPKKLFGLFFGILLLMSGIHTGIVLYMDAQTIYSVVKIIVPLVYWSLIALGLTHITRNQMRRVYEEPLQMFAKATNQVAKGDFSVYVPTVHSADQYDYLDRMILDFNAMVEDLGSIETLKTDFVSNVSHEMKTPIAVIQNYAQLLQKEEITEEERKEYAKTIQDASIRLSDLISNILKLNKLEHQTITPEVEIYDVCEQVVECIFQFEAKLEEKEIELETNLDERVFIRGDASLMELVWNNLLSNAIKFSNVGGLIEIQQTQTEHDVIVSLKDHGCGMDSITAAHIFDKFYQGDTSHAAEGNGLGLALAVRVVDLMNGKIWVESREGEGSTFFVKLPKAYDRK